MFREKEGGWDYKTIKGIMVKVENRSSERGIIEI